MGVTVLAVGERVFETGVVVLDVGDLDSALGLRDPPSDFGVTPDKLDMAVLQRVANSKERAAIELQIIVFCKLLDYCNK